MTNVSAAESATAKLLSEDEGDGLPPILPSTLGNMLAATYAGTHIQAVENRWKSSGKHVGGTKNKHGVVFIWSRRAEERGVCRLVDTALSLQNGFGQGPFLVQTVLLSELRSARFER